jgi:hypothetical protein
LFTSLICAQSGCYTTFIHGWKCLVSFQFSSLLFAMVFARGLILYMRSLWSSVGRESDVPFQFFVCWIFFGWYYTLVRYLFATSWFCCLDFCLDSMGGSRECWHKVMKSWAGADLLTWDQWLGESVRLSGLALIKVSLHIPISAFRAPGFPLQPIGDRLLGLLLNWHYEFLEKGSAVVPICHLLMHSFAFRRGCLFHYSFEIQSGYYSSKVLYWSNASMFLTQLETPRS